MSHPPRTVLVDFDGVISPNSNPLTIDLIHRFVSAHRPISRPDIEAIFRVAAPFPVSSTIECLFNGLGIGDRLGQFRESFSDFEDSGRIRIAPGFSDYASWCANQGIALRVITTASRQRLGRLNVPEDHIVLMNGESKADPGSYARLGPGLGLSPSHTLVIDDSPLALVSARKAGFSTVLMETRLYPRNLTEKYSRWINFRVKGWSGFLRLSKKFFR